MQTHDGWPPERREQLKVLDRLLRETSSIDDGNHCLMRIAECIAMAKDLSASNLFDGRDSFMTFLIKEAHK